MKNKNGICLLAMMFAVAANAQITGADGQIVQPINQAGDSDQNTNPIKQVDYQNLTDDEKLNGQAMRPESAPSIVEHSKEINPKTGLTYEEEQEYLNQGVIPPTQGGPLQRLPPNKVTTSPKQRYDERVSNLFPPTEEIHRIRKKKNAYEKALRNPKKLNTATRNVNLSFTNRRNIPTINIGPNYISSWSFVDEEGNPWEIKDISVSGQSFKLLDGAVRENTNLAQVENVTGYGNANATILLEGAPLMLTVNLTYEGNSTDSIVDFVIDGLSPTASSSISGSDYVPENNAAADSLMIAIRDGINPERKGLKRVKNSADMDIYQNKDKVYVRSDKAFISPACDAILSGGGTIKVCRFDYAPTEIGYLTRNNQIRYIRVQSEVY